MASLEDLILNGKPAGYCSSSEDEDDAKEASAAGPRPDQPPPGSSRNVKNGVPTLQAYRDGQLIGNFVRLSDEFGEDFYADEVESYLKEYGVLSDDPAAATTATRQLEADDSGSELDAN
uniref:Phosducin thioredoxin-like domain-containing protein n=1 Tax=Plectus sambesii TaxID=2011161 RepID=A0A914W907_9BILA